MQHWLMWAHSQNSPRERRKAALLKTAWAKSVPIYGVYTLFAHASLSLRC